MKLITLGTSCMFPTKERSQPAMLLFHNGIYLLFDAGEGAQRQLRIAGISPMSIDYLFITHWHGDHSLGVAGMIQCMSGNRRTKPFTIIGPKGTKERVNHLINAFDFKQNFNLIVKEFNNNDSIRIKDLVITARLVNHNSPTLSFCVKEDDKRRINVEYTKKFGLVQHPLLGKLQRGEDIVFNGNKILVKDATYIKHGKKFCYVTDTKYFPGLVEFVENADLFLCEATYLSDLEDEAVKRKHMTAEQAAMLASEAGVKKLILTHLSQRYTNPKPILNEAKKYFSKVIVANDFDVFNF